MRKTSTKKNETSITYKDKSSGQPELIPIFNEIKKMLLPYVKGSIVARGGTGGQLSLVSEKEITVEGRKKKEVYFASILVKKGYVGFYYMPVYVATEIKEIFHPELLKCLKGKSCFHIKKYDNKIFEQISEALKIGYQKYEAKGWV